jgi:hypothetical protein
MRVQQPCSSLGKYPEMLRKQTATEYACLQEFCKLKKPLEKRCASLTRRRSLVRTQHRPLKKYLQTTVFADTERGPGRASRPFCYNLDAGDCFANQDSSEKQEQSAAQQHNG